MLDLKIERMYDEAYERAVGKTKKDKAKGIFGLVLVVTGIVGFIVAMVLS